MQDPIISFLTVQVQELTVEAYRKGDCGLAAPIGLGRSTIHPSAAAQIGGRACHPTLLYTKGIYPVWMARSPLTRAPLSSLAPLTPPTAEARHTTARLRTLNRGHGLFE